MYSCAIIQNMKRLKVVHTCCMFLAIAFSPVVYGGESNTITTRPDVRGRIWQVSYTPDRPLEWVWPRGSTHASLALTAYSKSMSSVTNILYRENDAEVGTFSLPSSAGEERLYDVSIEIFSDDKAVESFSARVVLLPSEFDLLVEDSGDWRNAKYRRPRPMVYDSLWKDATSAVFTVSYSEKSKSIPLDGNSGFAPLNIEGFLDGYEGRFAASLGYDEELSTSDNVELNRIPTGLSLVVR